MQITLRSPLGVETMAIFRGGNMGEIGDHIRKLFHVPRRQNVELSKINESEYE
jgi:hypothetical protein